MAKPDLTLNTIMDNMLWGLFEEGDTDAKLEFQTQVSEAVRMLSVSPGPKLYAKMLRSKESSTLKIWADDEINGYKVQALLSFRRPDKFITKHYSTTILKVKS